LGGVTVPPSAAAAVFSRFILAVTVDATVPAAATAAVASGGALLDADQNRTHDEKVRVMNDGHRSDRPSRALLLVPVPLLLP